MDIFRKGSSKNFINIRIFSYLKFVDIVFVNHVKRLLPKSSINILIPHDIYDTFDLNYQISSPVNLKEDLFLLQFHYILSPNSVVSEYYLKKINILIKIKEAKKYINDLYVIFIVNIGYFKLDYVLKKINNYRRSNYVLILASYFGAFSTKKVFQLIDILRKKLPRLNIILRPHPSHLLYFSKFYEEFNYNYKFDKSITLDLDPVYIKSFSKSFAAVAEATGSSYTYAFSTLKPVIFYFPQRLNSYQKSTFYFKDISKIGILSNFEDIYVNIAKLYNNKKKFSNTIKKLRKKRIKNFRNSHKIFNSFVKNILSSNNNKIKYEEKILLPKV